MPALATWIGVPLLGGIIGYVTNWLAVKMIFRPIDPVSILGFRVQGLIGKRRAELADSIGKVVGDHLVSHEDVVKTFAKIDFNGVIRDVVDGAIGPKLAELRNLPMIGAFLSEERVASVREGIARGVAHHQPALVAKLERAVETELDVKSVVTEKIATFSIEKLESLILEVASRELRAIEWLGGVLGVLIGLVQVLLVWLLG